MEAQIGMDRFKWFDFLGAVVLLISVTKSALLPHDGGDQGDVAPAPSVADLVSKSSPQETTDQSLGVVFPSTKTVLEVGSDTVHGTSPSGHVVETSPSYPDCGPWLSYGQLDDAVWEDLCLSMEMEDSHTHSSTYVAGITR